MISSYEMCHRCWFPRAAGGIRLKNAFNLLFRERQFIRLDLKSRTFTGAFVYVCWLAIKGTYPKKPHKFR